MAYLECLHEIKLVIDLTYEGGIANLNYSISNNAEYGEYVTGPEVINVELRQAMRNAIKRIQDGEYTKIFLSEVGLAAGYSSMIAMRHNNDANGIELIGEQLRSIMPWIDTNKIVDKTKT